MSFSKHEGRPPQATDRPVKYDESPCKESIIIKSSLFGRLTTSPPSSLPLLPSIQALGDGGIWTELCMRSYWTSCIISSGLYNRTLVLNEFEECLHDAPTTHTHTHTLCRHTHTPKNPKSSRFTMSVDFGLIAHLLRNLNRLTMSVYCRYSRPRQYYLILFNAGLLLVNVYTVILLLLFK